MGAQLSQIRKKSLQNSIYSSVVKSVTNRFLKRSRRFIATVLIYSQLFQVAAVAAMPMPAHLNSSALDPNPINHSVPGTPVAAQPANLALNSQQFGLSGPLTWGANYSDLTGTFFNAQYVLPVNERLALAALGEYGSDQYRFGGTLGYGLTPLSQLKFTAERFGQRLPFQFDSGNIDQRVHQDAYGARLQQIVQQPFLQAINAGGYYANAQNKNLTPVLFTSNGLNCGGSQAGLNCINYRHIAGAASSGVDAGAEVLLTPSTWLGGNIYYDQVRYNTKFIDASYVNRDGLGGAVKINQLFNNQFKFFGEASVRKIYDSYQGGVSWLAPVKTFGLELSLTGQRLISHNATPNNNSVSLQVNWIPGSKTYSERFNWKDKQLTGVAQWVQAPAVHMNQVLTISEQITRMVAPTITAITPNSGAIAGGNLVTVTGSNFAPGARVLFGGQLATAVTPESTSVLRVQVPAAPGGTPGVVNVVVQNPDGQQSVFTDGYTYGAVLSPAIKTVQMAKGNVSGGETVTITGANFNGLTRVTFGGVAALITENKATQITVTTPSHEAGVVDVEVITEKGSTKAIDSYIYESASDFVGGAITGISPNSGSIAGGKLITITGKNFTPDTVVKFGDNLATDVTVVSSTELTVKTPVGDVGAVDVLVTTSNNNSFIKANGYTYFSPFA